LVVYLLARGLRDPRYFSRIWERLGFLPHAFQGTAPGAIWLHAVSVGEVMSALRLLRGLRAEYRARRIFVSSTTLAGRALAEEKLKGLVDGVFYAPIDYCFAVRNVLRVLRPSVVVILETEIWPHWYREIKRSGAGLLIANGRISDKAWPRYRRLKWFWREVLPLADAILTQSPQATSRFRELGAPAERVRCAGNLKYDFDATGAKPPEPVRKLLERCGPAEIWIAASTMPPAHPGDVDEDDAVISAFRELAKKRRDLVLILAPRRPARFPIVTEKLERAGVPFLRRSTLTGEEPMPVPGVLLLDTIGELYSLFSLADVVFMGGSLADRGGHNILEPAFFARPVIIGPHMENFAEIAQEFRKAGAVMEIQGPAELAPALESLLADSLRREALGSNARRIAEGKGGAAKALIEEVRRLSSWSIAARLDPLPVFLLLKPLTWLWHAGVAWRRTRALRHQRRLGAPVISIGGLGVGGAGKTPFTAYLARRLHEKGWSVAVLTRGYRRRVPEKVTVLEAGSSAPVSVTGDEAQLLLRTGVAHLGIGADRYQTGRLIEKRFHPDVILLDDGFQHWRLARELDVVLIDALDPWCGGALVPLGRQREPMSALARADLFIITRVEPGSPVDGICARLRELNPGAPIFQSRIRPTHWVDAATGNRVAPGALRGRPHAAFCALANPASFWRTVAGLGCRPLRCWKFSDHHHYKPRELKRMAADAKAAGAEVLLTTEKDLMNLPPDAAGLVAPLRLLWLQAEVEVDGEAELLNLIDSRLRGARHGRPPLSPSGELRAASGSGPTART